MITDSNWEMWQEQGLFNNSTIRLWLSTWNMGIKHQRHYGIAMLVRGISCMLMKNKIMIQTKTGQLDPRIPIIYFSDSGSGKGMGQNFYQAIFKNVGLQISSLAKPTPEKLIGSYDDQLDKENRKKGLTSRDEKYRDPVLHGFFETEDDIIFDEAECFFDGKDYGNDVLRKSRMALDKYGSPNNYLKSETLKNRGGYSYPCKCNVIFLSYHVPKISTQIISNGIFQRALCFFYRLGQEQMQDILLNPTNDLQHIIDTNKQRIVAQLKEVETHIQNMTTNLTLSDSADAYIQKIMLNELKEIYKQDDEIGQMIQSFLPRLKDTTIKMAGALAILKKKSIIDKIDIEEAQTITLGVSFPSLVRELFVFGVMADKQRQWYQDLKRNIGTKLKTKDEINSIMGAVWGVSRPTVITRLKQMRSLFYVKKGKKNGKFYQLK